MISYYSNFFPTFCEFCFAALNSRLQKRKNGPVLIFGPDINWDVDHEYVAKEEEGKSSHLKGTTKNFEIYRPQQINPCFLLFPKETEKFQGFLRVKIPSYHHEYVVRTVRLPSKRSKTVHTTDFPI